MPWPFDSNPSVTPWNTTGNVTSGSNPTRNPYPNRQLPPWMPTMDAMTGELQSEYGRVRGAFDTTAYDTASTRTEANTLTSGLNAGNNAATAYANKARQAGGSGLGAGLVKAEGAVAGRRAAGDIALERAKFDIQQREGAATQAANIASTLGDLRNRYLSSLVNYTTSEDRISASESASGGGVGGRRRGPSGGYNIDAAGNTSGGYGDFYNMPSSGYGNISGGYGG